MSRPLLPTYRRLAKGNQLELFAMQGLSFNPSAKDELKFQLPHSDKSEYIRALAELADRCERCSLGKSARKIGHPSVLSKGPVNAKIMIVAEAPGKDELIEKKPLVGTSGRLWHRMLEEIGIDANKLYHTNVLLCKVDKSTDESRMEDQLKACAPYLEHQLFVVRPVAIIALGSSAMKRFGIRGAHSPLDDELVTHKYQGIPVAWTAHPAYVCRQMQDYDRVKAKLLSIFTYIQQHYKVDVKIRQGDDIE